MQRTAVVLVSGLLGYAATLGGAAGAGNPVRPQPGRLTIEQAVTEALAQNLTLLADRANIGIAGARLISARMRPNPIVSAGGDHLDLLGTRFSETNGAGPAEFNLRSDFLLERGGKRERRVEAAAEARAVAEYAFLEAARGLVLDTRSAFIDAQLSRDSLALARQNLESLNRIVEINEARVRAGDLSKVELIRSRLAARQFQNSVRQGEFRLRSALTRLATLVGRTDPNSIREVEGELRRDVVTPAIGELQTDAAARRPDLIGLRRELARAKAEIALQIAGARQDVSIGTEYRRQNGINGKSNSVGFFLEIPLPVFNRNEGEIERARQEHRQAELRLGAAERAVIAEVESAYQQFLTARDLSPTSRTP
jgi:cobalt-zinc-cadmium efflux system outer membrane protein